MGKQPHQQDGGSWQYPPLEEAMREERLEELETYINRIQNKVAQCISTRTILEICLESERQM